MQINLGAKKCAAAQKLFLAMLRCSIYI